MVGFSLDFRLEGAGPEFLILHKSRGSVSILRERDLDLERFLQDAIYFGRKKRSKQRGVQA